MTDQASALAVRPRHEYKYVHTHAVAEALLERLSDVMEPDPNSGTAGYEVNSIYFDTDQFSAYFEKLDGVDPRYKLRARFYGALGSLGDLEDKTVFLEAKHRTGPLIQKNRLALPGTILPELAEGPLNASLFADSASHAAQRLSRLVTERVVYPTCRISYRRRAWVTRVDPSLRVTIDTNLRVAGPGAFLRVAGDNGNLFLPQQLCVIELKFHWAMPLWLLSICREVGLQVRRYSKYCSGLERLLPNVAYRDVVFQEPW